MPRTSRHAIGTPLRASIAARMTSQMALVVCFTVVALTSLSFVLARSMLIQARTSQLHALAMTAEETIERDMRLSRERAALLTSHETVRSLLEDRQPTRELPALLASLRNEQSGFIGLTLFSRDRREIASAGSGLTLPEGSIEASILVPLIGSRGWESYGVFAPVRDDQGRRLGVLGVRFSTRTSLMSVLSPLSTISTDAQALLSLTQGNDILLIHPSQAAEQSYVLYFDRSGFSAALPLARAIAGEEGLFEGEDHEGKQVFSAYRFLPALGWGLSVQAGRASVLSGLSFLSLSHLAAGGMLLIFSLLLASTLARRLTIPLRSLAERVAMLQPGRWNIRRTLRTGDEVEVLEGVIADMASRLGHLYEHLEEEVRKRTEELKRQYALDRAVLGGIDHGILAVDTEGKVTIANAASLRLLRQDQESIVGRPVTEVFDVRGHRGATLEGAHPLLRCLRRKESCRGQPGQHWNLHRKDGTFLPILWVTTPLLEGDRCFGSIVVFQDISEERKIDYMKSDFISLASHQLRTPISAMRWYTELLSDERDLSAHQRGYVEEMQRSLSRVVNLLNALLHAAHLEGETLKPEMQAVDLCAEMKEILDDAQSLAHDAKSAFDSSCPAGAFPIRTDPNLLRIVVQNLLTNAFKYARGKSVRLTVVEEGASAVLCVEDTGIGIPLSEQKNVFQKFFRAKNVRHLDTDGNGLGLYITKSIVERLGGTIEFESTEDKGTRFVVRLPVAPAKKHKS